VTAGARRAGVGALERERGRGVLERVAHARRLPCVRRVAGGAGKAERTVWIRRLLPGPGARQQEQGGDNDRGAGHAAPRLSWQLSHRPETGR